ncbi:DUF2939 domain-containing protein [Microbulbifer bruguierae]|uniref:DUF2939 domain-containing protein n=1 Tax=Microbulbifer bruguierae TaxID=3029061 RepID=A0ABY8NB15_9GAMM|nr:DUF2939 domain-containing protein [Microbulbifer bruguierae]WGL15594.1 DUF2939 domain-containing protein [Microbulbifer bruguierae]
MVKWLLRGLVLQVLAGLVYAALPWYSARQLVDAAQHDDVTRLERYIDFPQLRGNIRRHLQDELRSSMSDNFPAEFGDLFAAGSDLLLGPLVDHLISPEGIADLIQGRQDWREFERELERVFSGSRQQSAPRSPSLPPERAAREGEVSRAAHDHHWKLQRWYFSGFNTVHVVCGSDDDTRVALILQRQGLRWRLVDMARVNSQSMH